MSKKMARRAGTSLSTETQQKLAKQLEEQKDRVEGASGRMIRLSGKRFTFPDGTKIKDPLECVIVDFMAWNAYYDEPYDEDNLIPPVCYAFNKFPKQLEPSENCAENQNEGGTCHTCNWNKFGTAENGKGKACQNRRVFALLPPDAEEGDEMMLISASPTSVKRFDQYVSSLNEDGYLPITVITSLDFDDDVDYPSLTFEMIEENPDVEFFANYSGQAVEMLTQEPSYEAEEEEKPKPARKKVAKKKVAKKKASPKRRRG